MLVRSLYAKLSLALALLLIVVGIVYATVNLSMTQRHLDAINQTLNRDLAHNLVADRNLVRSGALDDAALKQAFHDYMQINPNIEIYLLDAGGRIISFSADPDKVIRERVSLEPIKTFLQQPETGPVLGDDPRSLERKKAFSVTPVPSAENVDGYLYVVLRGEAFDVVANALRENYLLGISVYAIVISLIVALLLGMVIFWMMTRRLRSLSDAVDRFRASDFASQSSKLAISFNPEGDEIDRLGQTFVLMASKIAHQIEMLKSQDAARREMVANISHDLRTPLASMNGYLETMKLKADKLTQVETRDYLEVALKYGQQLARLVEDLFELAKLDTFDQKLNEEPFSVSDLVQDVLQKLHIEAAKKDVQIETEIASEIPLARGDIRLIERVLENVLVNAMHHTPSGTGVRVRVLTSNGGVRVEIIDNGPGIAPTDIPHVFQRFFQGDTSAAGHTTHAGLGLAIAKRIMELHGQDIRVTSTPGAGAVFTFELAGHRASPPAAGT